MSADDALRHLCDSTWLHIVENYSRNFIEVILTPSVGVLSSGSGCHRLSNTDEATGGTLVVGVLASYKLVDFVLTGDIVHHGGLVVCGSHSVPTASLSSQWLLEYIFGLVQHANLLNSIHWVGDLRGCWRLGTLR